MLSHEFKLCFHTLRIYRYRTGMFTKWTSITHRILTYKFSVLPFLIYQFIEEKLTSNKTIISPTSEIKKVYFLYSLKFITNFVFLRKNRFECLWYYHPFLQYLLILKLLNIIIIEKVQTRPFFFSILCQFFSFILI